MQTDMSLFLIYFGLPLLLMLARAGWAAYTTKKKREELQKLEEKATPFTRRL